MQVITKTIEAYTLEELKAFDDNGSAYDDAIETVKNWVDDDCDWPQFMTEDLNMWLEEEKPVAEVTMSGWDFDRGYAHVKGDIDIAAFMKANKLNGKYRALAYAIKHLDCFPSAFGFDTDRQRDQDDRFSEQMIDGLYRNTYMEEEEPARYKMIEGQIEAIGKLIDSYISGLESKTLKNICDEVKYRGSDEYALQEIEAQEFLFTKEGKIVRQ